MGLLAPQDWQAQWIDAAHPLPTAPLPPIALRHAAYETLDGHVSRDVTDLLARRLREPGTAPFAVDNSVLGGATRQ